MKKGLISMLVVAVCLFSSTCPAIGESSLMFKGKSYMDARMWNDAIKVLNKVIDTDPKNAEAHVLLGKCYGETGDSYSSNERYKSAIALSLVNSGKVSRALLLLSPEQIAMSRKLFDDEIEKRPSLRKKVASQLFDYGVAKLKEHEISNANALFPLAIGYDIDLTYRVCDTFYQLGIKGDDEAALYFPIGRGYCYNNTKRMGDMGERILRYAARTNGEIRKNLKEKALLFISQQRVDEVIPPPSWQTVLERKFEGRGLNDDDWIPIASAGIDIKIGDHLIITGNKFDFFDKGKWQTYENRMEMTNIIGTNGAFGAKAEKGEQIKVEILRLTE